MKNILPGIGAYCKMPEEIPCFVFVQRHGKHHINFPSKKP